MKSEKTTANDDTNLLRQQLHRGDAISDQRQIDDLVCKLTPTRELWRPREKDEDFEIVDAAGNGRQLTAPRWICHLLALRHRCAHVLVSANHPGMGRLFLLQVRSWDKADSPGHLDISAAGHALLGAASAATAEAEMYEELGLRLEDLRGGELLQVGRYEHDEMRVGEHFYNCEWREVYVGVLVSDGMSKLQMVDGEVAGLFLCPERQLGTLLGQTLIPLASALRMSLPLCLPGV